MLIFRIIKLSQRDLEADLMEKAFSDFGQIFSGKLDIKRWTIYFWEGKRPGLGLTSPKVNEAAQNKPNLLSSLEHEGNSSLLTRIAKMGSLFDN